MRSVNYRWRAVKGMVYTVGAARRREGPVRAIEIARDTEGGGKIVTHLGLH